MPKSLAAHRYIFSVNALADGFSRWKYPNVTNGADGTIGQNASYELRS